MDTLSLLPFWNASQGLVRHHLVVCFGWQWATGFIKTGWGWRPLLSMLSPTAQSPLPQGYTSLLLETQVDGRRTKEGCRPVSSLSSTRLHPSHLPFLLPFLYAYSVSSCWLHLSSLTTSICKMIWVHLFLIHSFIHSSTYPFSDLSMTKQFFLPVCQLHKGHSLIFLITASWVPWKNAGWTEGTHEYRMEEKMEDTGGGKNGRKGLRERKMEEGERRERRKMRGTKRFIC